MKNQLLLFLAFTAFAFVGCKNDAAQTTAADGTVLIRVDINVEQFKEKMSGENMVLLDVRTPEEIAEGKIEGAVEMDFYADDFEQKALAMDKNKTYLIYCRSGNRSGQTCDLMNKNGFKAVYNLDGGFTAWSGE